MTEEYFRLPLEKRKYSGWKDICGLNQYQYYLKEEKEIIKPFLPNGLKDDYFDKLDGVMVMCSGSTDSSCTYFVLKFERNDEGDLIDEDPLAVMFDSGQESTPSGLILLHGMWPGRTSPFYVPNSVSDKIENCEINRYYPSSATFIKIPKSGPLSTFEQFSDNDALDRVINKFKEINFGN